MIIKVVETVGAKLNADGIYEMTESQYSQLDTELGNSDIPYSLCKNKKDETKRAIYDVSKKNRYCIIKLVKEKEVKKSVKKSDEKTEKKTVVRTGATVKVYGEKKLDGRSYKVIEVNNTKKHHYETWLAVDGKRKKVGSSESKEEMIELVKAA